MTRLSQFYVAVVMLVGCASPERVTITPDEQSSKADGMPSNLDLIDDHRTDIDEPSDLAFWDGKLWMVSDVHSRIYELDDDGDVRGTQDVKGTDMEAIAIDADGRFYVADESAARVWRLDGHGDREQSFEIATTDGNSGIEGLAFDDEGVMYVAKEKNPATIIRIDPESGKEIDRAKLDYTDDLSALAFIADDALLYGLSDEEQKLYRFDKNFEVMTSWKLPIEQAEGLAIDGGKVYIVSDSEERLYVFELD